MTQTNQNYLQHPVSRNCRYISLVSTLQMHQSYILIELYLWKVINMTETAAEGVIWPSISYLRNSQYPKNCAACWLANHLLTSSFANLKKFQEFALILKYKLLLLDLAELVSYLIFLTMLVIYCFTQAIQLFYIKDTQINMDIDIFAWVYRYLKELHAYLHEPLLHELKLE